MLSRTFCIAVVAGAIAALPVAALAAVNGVPVAPWSIQINEVDAGDSNIAPEFKAAIYENLVKELTRTKRFSTVLRSGDRRAGDTSNLLVLKTTVESFTPGSETKRAVTSVMGATKLKVRVQLRTRDGEEVLERIVDGNVRFFGTNLKAANNLARQAAKALDQAPLPGPQ